MIALREAGTVHSRPDTVRWAACLTLAFGMHAAGAAALWWQWSDTSDRVANAPVVLIELAPVPVAPDVMPSEVPPGPQQAEAQAQPQSELSSLDEKIENEADLAKDAELPANSPATAEKPAEKRLIRKHASLASAPSTSERHAERSAAPAPGTSAHNPDAVPNWKSALVARLERYKRYPAEAQSRGEHGVAQLAFSIDRSGGVHHPHITRSSGSIVLDRETLALAQRAAPMPPPPPEVAGAQIPVTVPIRYSAR